MDSNHSLKVYNLPSVGVNKYLYYYFTFLLKAVVSLKPSKSPSLVFGTGRSSRRKFQMTSRHVLAKVEIICAITDSSRQAPTGNNQQLLLDFVFNTVKMIVLIGHAATLGIE